MRFDELENFHSSLDANEKRDFFHNYDLTDFEISENSRCNFLQESDLTQIQLKK